jgi:type I restriction enzyme S subunit
MSNKVDKSNWKPVKLGDVALWYQRNISNDKLADSGIAKYAIANHIDTDEIFIKRFSLISKGQKGPTVTKHFEEGDFLLSTRSVALRKAAVANFSGVTGEKLLVLRRKDNSLLSGMLLPFVCHSNAFWKYAQNSASGSVNKFTSWTKLREYEFLLPPKDKQKEIEELLYAANDYIEQLKRLKLRHETLVSSYRNKLFTDDCWEIKRLSDFYDVQLGKMLSAKNQTGEFPRKYLTNKNVQWGKIDYSDLNEMDFNEKDRNKFQLVSGDLLVCEGGEIGRTAIWRGEVTNCYYQKAIHRLRSKNGRYLPEIFLQFMIWANRQGTFKGLTGHSTIAHLTAVELKGLKLPSIPIEVQESWKLKFEKAIDFHNKIDEQLKSAKALAISINNKVF